MFFCIRMPNSSQFHIYKHKLKFVSFFKWNELIVNLPWSIWKFCMWQPRGGRDYMSLNKRLINEKPWTYNCIIAYKWIGWEYYEIKQLVQFSRHWAVAYSCMIWSRVIRAWRRFISRTDRQMDRWTNGRVDGWTIGRMDEWSYYRETDIYRQTER